MEDFRRSKEEGPDDNLCDFIGLLNKSTSTHATLEEINKATSQGWAKSGMDESIAPENTVGKESQQKEAASSSSIKVSDLKVFDPADYINNAEDVMLFLKDSLAGNDPVSLAEALEVIYKSEGLSKLTQKKPPVTSEFYE